MTNGRVEVITSVERRRRWGLAEKRRLVAASLEAGASVAAIAREAGIQNYRKPSHSWADALATHTTWAGPAAMTRSRC